MPSDKVSNRNTRAKHSQATTMTSEPSTSQKVAKAQFRRNFRRARAGYKWIIDEVTLMPRQVKANEPSPISRSPNSCNRGYWAISDVTGLPSWRKLPIQSGCLCPKCVQMGIASEPWIGRRVRVPINTLIPKTRAVSVEAERDL